jgi:hypothetical protein
MNEAAKLPMIPDAQRGACLQRQYAPRPGCARADSPSGQTCLPQIQVLASVHSSPFGTKRCQIRFKTGFTA